MIGYNEIQVEVQGIAAKKVKEGVENDGRIDTKVRSRQTRGEMAVWRERSDLYRSLAGRRGRPWKRE